MNKRELIDTVLYHRRVVKPRIKYLSSLRKSELVRLAKKEGMKIVGGKKARIAQAQNIAMNRVSNRLGSMKRIVEDVANSEVIELALSRN